MGINVITLIILISLSTELSANESLCNNDINTNYQHHHSWKATNVASPKTDDIQQIINTLQQIQQSSPNNLQIPIYDITDENFNPNNAETQSKIYDSFYNKVGALIITGAYSKNIMSEYNKWCESFLEIAKKDGNCRHPKQPGKYLINDVMMRLGRDNPNLLLKLINNNYFTLFSDILLGFMKFGSVTTHWIEAGGDRQLSHVDYPIHVGSGPFWQHSVHKLMNLTTRNQINNILPFYSIQVLIASDKMNSENGATELIAGSHLISDIDALILNKQVYDELEAYFTSVHLEQGDILIFNRRLVHRGGRNNSDKRRNSLIMQCVWLWGVGQEIIDSDELISCLEKCDEYNELDEQQREVFLTRIKPPYPADIKKQT